MRSHPKTTSTHARCGSSGGLLICRVPIAGVAHSLVRHLVAALLSSWLFKDSPNIFIDQGMIFIVQGVLSTQLVTSGSEDCDDKDDQQVQNLYH